MKLTFEGPSGEVDTIIGLLRGEILKCEVNILDCIQRNDLNYLHWWQVHKGYIESIVGKILVDKD